MKFFQNREKLILLTVLLAVLFIFYFFYLKSRNDIERDIAGAQCIGCNVILISIDTLRADHLGSYGYYRDTSPNIDKIAEKSILFERAIAQSPWTLSSHVSILSGLFPSRHGVLTKYDRIKDTLLTLPDILHEKDYKTAAFTDGGFVSKKYNYHYFSDFFDVGWVNCHDSAPTQSFQNMYAWLEDNYQQKFFLFWHTYQVHSPYVPPDEYDIFSDQDYDGIVNVSPDLKDPVCENYKIQPDPHGYCTCKHWVYFDKVMDQITETDIEYVKSKYDGDIFFVDQQISQLMELIEEKGIDEKTVIIITSDHGESFVDREIRKKVGHAILYDEVLRVPLIIKVPGIEQGMRVKNMVETIDIMPTVLSLLGIDIPSGLDGINIFDMLNGTLRKYWAKSVHIHLDQSSELEKVEEEYYAVYFKDFKMIYYKNEGLFELYNLKKDPHERENIFGNHPQVEMKMKKYLQKWALSMEKGAAGNDHLNITPSEFDKIKSLGYL